MHQKKESSGQLEPETVTSFAVALDHEDYATALALLDTECVYVIQGKSHGGPEAIPAPGTNWSARP